ncbi:hypothetical protein M758_9G030300 [Ceratodon purpureus]|uniref:Uncharacterized protein n=1 Tax=Ceratodon purpureus TaxID=3225 RepID=A0A8T0GS46_CERPU|nr:hypothetical protein KC19_9G028800 [Ceratodon purpureus]KAG0605088.1 hypothetical protein M758_9G030300 [Ceratodon purpureus]
MGCRPVFPCQEMLRKLLNLSRTAHLVPWRVRSMSSYTLRWAKLKETVMECRRKVNHFSSAINTFYFAFQGVQMSLSTMLMLRYEINLGFASESYFTATFPKH